MDFYSLLHMYLAIKSSNKKRDLIANTYYAFKPKIAKILTKKHAGCD